MRKLDSLNFIDLAKHGPHQYKIIFVTDHRGDCGATHSPYDATFDYRYAYLKSNNRLLMLFSSLPRQRYTIDISNSIRQINHARLCNRCDHARSLRRERIIYMIYAREKNRLIYRFYTWHDQQFLRSVSGR